MAKYSSGYFDRSDKSIHSCTTSIHKDDIGSGQWMINLFSKVHSVLTVTQNNGSEFADHVRVACKTGALIFFSKPYASWQAGTNENTNGRIRRFWPKKFDMAPLTDEDIEGRILILNLTPRKVLGSVTPLEVFTGRRVALIA